MSDIYIFCNRAWADTLFDRGGWDPGRHTQHAFPFEYDRFAQEGGSSLRASVGGLALYICSDDETRRVRERFDDPIVIVIVVLQFEPARSISVLERMLDDRRILVADECGHWMNGDEFVAWLRAHPGEFALPSADSGDDAM